MELLAGVALAKRATHLDVGGVYGALTVVLAATDATSSCSVPATTATGRVVHGSTRAQLDPAHAQRIIGITDEGDRGLIALAACQAYVREVSR